MTRSPAKHANSGKTNPRTAPRATPVSSGCAHYSPQPCPTGSARCRRRNAASPAGPCLDCSFHDPGGRASSGIHIAHRSHLQRLAADAAERGDTEAAELNTTMLDKVTKLIGEIDPDAPLETP